MKKFYLIFLIFALWRDASAYTRIAVSSGEAPKWRSMPVSYWINAKGLSTISNGSEFAAVRASFQTWENVASADVQFTYRGTTSAPGIGHDGMNVVSFSDTTTPLGSSTLAATFNYFKSEVGSDNQIHVVMDEADILFNPNFDFSTSAEADKYDIQVILTHEVGHLLGLDHSAMISSVMQPFAVPSQLDQRMLAYDDIAGITEIYPKPNAYAGLGQIQGAIRSGTASTFGASVVAINTSGTPLVSTLSQPNGTYAIKFLPPGTYRVLAEPLDLPVIKDNLGGFYAGTRTDFGTTYFGNVSTLSEAQSVTVLPNNGIATADIQTLVRSATGLNLTRPASAMHAARGGTYSITIGGEDITPGVNFSASNSGVFLGSPSFGGRISSVASTSAKMDLAVSAATPLGPKNLAVNRGSDASIGTGMLVITDAVPSNIAVGPGNGPIDGGTPVTITGTSFRAGAQVYFGGLAATDLNVLSDGSILATTPQNTPGSANVVVVNPDGTWGMASRTFSYDAPPAAITSVTPLSGSPATVVTIEGVNFDSHLQNLVVLFNGIPARILNATTQTITTIVPYGVTTGPITVSVFGRSVMGPVFIVTTTTPSTNVAPSTFNFIDASASGGGTSLTFDNDDDAVTSAFLPFNFSLFRDIYLAGSPISVSTNGFLSFESVLAGQTFQNGSLPGQSVPQPSGGSGVIPPSLIAPFWDDLLLKGNSVVTTRSVGDAPNRQFVVEWSNVDILDEEGKDQNASLTFEAVLFEGSNDIQFLYNSLSGPRSDGSGATIGIQDLKRTTAIQTGFNQPVVSSGYFTTYRFANGGFTQSSADTTPPLTAAVTDEGAVTANKTQLAASWASSDPESGIREFQYAIGTTPGGTDVRGFTSTTQNSAFVSGLNLQAGATYYFAVKAVNGGGLVSDTGISDGIRYDPAYQPQIKLIPSAPESNVEFSGLALLAPTAMTVVLRAYDATGSPILGSGIRNPATISLTAGQQVARLLPELFGFQSFDGWIEAEASAPGLGVFTATGAWDGSTLDGSVARDPSSDFVLFHSGATAVFVNPSPRVANVTMNSLDGSGSQSFSIPARGRYMTTLTSAVRVQSSEALAAIERSERPGKLGIDAAVAVTEAASTLVFPHSVVGGGYTSSVMLANISGTTQTISVSGPGVQPTVIVLEPNRSTQVGLTPRTAGVNVGSVTVSPAGIVPQALGVVGVLDVENETGLVTIGARPAATEFVFPHVANGNGLFTGLAFAAGSNATRITVEIYDSTGNAPKSATFTLGPNQQLGRLVIELVAGVANQLGGYIRIHSDQPIWAWEVYGSGQVMASGPPL